MYIFLSEGGGGTGFLTEKHNPCAWPGWWYGSCPTITTFRLSILVYLKALKISYGGG